MRLGEYLTKELPYKFVIFYNIPVEKKAFFHSYLGAHPEDNAYVTYCYIDAEQGISYHVICTAKIDFESGQIFYNMQSCKTNALTLREGGLECDAIVWDEIEEFEDEAIFIKENYGYFSDAVEVDDSVPFDKFRHPFYKDDIYTVLRKKNPDDNDRKELIWTRFDGVRDGEIYAHLINEPFNESFGLSNGDFVKLEEGIIDGEVWPTIFV